MASLSQAKTLGGIGSILVLLAFIPTAGAVISIIGLILTLIAVKYISDSVADPAIFRNMIISVILSIIGIIVGAVVVFSTIFSMFGLAAFTNPSSVANQNVPAGFTVGAIAAVIGGLAVIWIFLLISAFFLRRSYNSIGARLGVGYFRTTGLLYLIGAGLTIIFVGFIILLVAEIMQIIAFFSVPEQLPPMAAEYTVQGAGPPPPPATGAQPTGTTICSRCGASLPQGTMYCPSCGQKQTA